MIDLSIINPCDHGFKEKLVITTVNGVSTTTLSFAPNSAVKIINITIGKSDYEFILNNNVITFTQDYFELSANCQPKQEIYAEYYLKKEDCDKCVDGIVSGDINIQNTYISLVGSFLDNTQLDKNYQAVKQALLKILETSVGSNFFDENYGAGLEDFIGKKDVETAPLQSNVYKAIEYLITQQLSDELLTGSEQIKQLVSISGELIANRLKLTFTVLLNNNKVLQFSN